MSASPPFFNGQAAYAFRRNRLYRIYVREDDLVFIWAGSGSEGLHGAQTVARQQGLLGRIILSPFRRLLDPSKKNAARLAVLEQTALPELLHDDPRNFVARIGDIVGARLVPRSERHARTFSDHRHAALFLFRHRTLGKFRIGLLPADVPIAMRELPRLLGSRCRVEIAWNESERRAVLLPGLPVHREFPIGGAVFAAIALIGGLIGCFFWANFRPPNPDDFTTITGTVLSGKEHLSNNKYTTDGYLDLRIAENPVLFRVPTDGYMDYFRRAEFFQNVKTGTPLQLTVPKTQLAQPFKPALGSEPQIFVRAVADASHQYYTFQDHIRWKTKNNRWLLFLWSGLFAYVAFWLFKTFIVPRLPRKPSGALPDPVQTADSL